MRDQVTNIRREERLTDAIISHASRLAANYDGDYSTNLIDNLHECGLTTTPIGAHNEHDD